MEKTKYLPLDLILCIQKLLSSISTLRRHFSSLTKQQYNTLMETEESNIKLQVSDIKYHQNAFTQDHL